MRNFTFTGLSTSAVLLLALAGCHQDPPRLVDAGHTTTDTGMNVDAFTPGVDTGVMPGNDAGRDGGSGGACTYGGGCDLRSTTGCPMDASGNRQGCYPQSGSPMCAPAGTALDGATCTALNDCDAGLVCLGSGTCARVCCSAADCNTGELCNPLGDGTTHMPLPNGVGYCHRPAGCTPIPAAGCTAGNTCTTTMADGTTDCVPTGATPEGGDCSSVNCAEGLGCFTSGTSTAGVCYRFCRRAMGNADCMPAHPTCGAGLGTTYGLCM